MHEINATDAYLGLEPRTHAEIIHDKLSWQWQSTVLNEPEREERPKQYFFELVLGWDALTHNRYRLLSGARSISAYSLTGYAQETKRQSVKLLPAQLKALAACAEVADIPFHPLNEEIPIPESAFHLNDLLLAEAERTTPGRKQIK